MKIGILFRFKVKKRPTEFVEGICACYPTDPRKFMEMYQRRGEGFAELAFTDADDDRIVEVRELLEAFGYRPQTTEDRSHPDVYQSGYTFKYERKDIVNAEWLFWSGAAYRYWGKGKESRDSDGNLILEKHALPARAHTMNTAKAICVSSKLRSVLEELEVPYLGFKPVFVDGGQSQCEYWEIGRSACVEIVQRCGWESREQGVSAEVLRQFPGALMTDRAVHRTVREAFEKVGAKRNKWTPLVLLA